MNIPIDVKATFNTTGDIKPEYIRIEDNNYQIHICKVKLIKRKENIKYSGINAINFRCIIEQNELQKEIEIRYNIDSHKWVYIN